MDMDFFETEEALMVFTSTLLLLLTRKSAFDALIAMGVDEDAPEEVLTLTSIDIPPCLDNDIATSAALHNFQLCNIFSLLDEDLGFWVKPRSTAWFSRFLLEHYDDERWIKMFRMNKAAVFALADLLRPQVEKKNTRYCFVVPVLIRVACTLFKLTHGARLIICSEFFAVGKSTVSLMLREVVHAINDTLREEIKWPSGERLIQTQADFQNLCGLPGVVAAIDGVHILISKPKFVPVDYYYFKAGGYSMNCQAVVDSKKRFLDLYLGMPGSTNDARMLRRSILYHQTTHGNIFDPRYSVSGFSLYLLGDGGYPLLPWLMVPHSGFQNLSMAASLFNRRMRRGRGVVENAFGMLKQTFRELLGKSELDVAFLPDVILCCSILHNVLLKQSHDEVQILLEVLRSEGLDGEFVRNAEVERDLTDVTEDELVPQGSKKREALGVYLALNRHPIT